MTSLKPKPRPKKREAVGGMVPLERAAKSGKLPGLVVGGRKRSDIAKRYRNIVGAGRTTSEPADSADDTPSIYGDDEE